MTSRMNPSKNENQKRSKSRFRIQWNIGTIIFGALFVYMMILLLIYLTAHHVTSYQVVNSPLSRNETYTALVLRDETLCTAPAGGYPVYFTADESKIGKNNAVVGLSDTPASESVSDAAVDAGQVRDSLKQFSRNYDSNDFTDVLREKYSLMNSVAVSGTDSFYDGTVMTADGDGIICYSSDGRENLDESQITTDDFSSQGTYMTSLMTDSRINSGDPVYRLINSETWEIMIPISDKQTVELGDFKTIKVKFLKDNRTESGTLTLLKNGDQRYAKITFTSGMLRYCTERLLEVELLTNTSSGLKIPVSALVTKEFYMIPTTMCVSGGDSDEVGFMRVVTDEDGNESTEFVEATLYQETTEGGDDGEDSADQEDAENSISYYYVDKSLFEPGDVLIQPDSTIRYTVEKTGTLQGVYCINKGYAVFRKVEILDQNEEYCIAAKNTSFGISEYDYIIWDASDVTEDQIL